MVGTAYSRISRPAGASSSLVCVVALKREGDQGEFGRVGVGEESDPQSLLSFSKGSEGLLLLLEIRVSQNLAKLGAGGGWDVVNLLLVGINLNPVLWR